MHFSQSWKAQFRQQQLLQQSMQQWQSQSESLSSSLVTISTQNPPKQTRKKHKHNKSTKPSVHSPLHSEHNYLKIINIIKIATRREGIHANTI